MLTGALRAEWRGCEIQSRHVELRLYGTWSGHTVRGRAVTAWDLIQAHRAGRAGSVLGKQELVKAVQSQSGCAGAAQGSMWPIWVCRGWLEATEGPIQQHGPRWKRCRLQHSGCRPALHHSFSSRDQKSEHHWHTVIIDSGYWQPVAWSEITSGCTAGTSAAVQQ